MENLESQNVRPRGITSTGVGYVDRTRDAAGRTHKHNRTRGSADCALNRVWRRNEMGVLRDGCAAVARPDTLRTARFRRARVRRAREATYSIVAAPSLASCP